MHYMKKGGLQVADRPFPYSFLIPFLFFSYSFLILFLFFSYSFLQSFDMSSRDLPLVSGTSFHTNTAAATQITP